MQRLFLCREEPFVVRVTLACFRFPWMRELYGEYKSFIRVTMLFSEALFLKRIALDDPRDDVGKLVIVFS